MPCLNEACLVSKKKEYDIIQEIYKKTYNEKHTNIHYCAADIVFCSL